jgi:hypothetical protein
MRPQTQNTETTALCLACGDELPLALHRTGSVRCQDCRDAAAPLSLDLARSMATNRPSRGRTGPRDWNTAARPLSFPSRDRDAA